MSRLPKLQRLTAPGEHLDPVNPSVKGSTWLIAGSDLRACSDGKRWRIKPRDSSDWQNRAWLKDNQLFQVAFLTREALLRAYMAAADVSAPPKPSQDPLGPLKRISRPGEDVLYGVADVRVFREDGKWKVLFADRTKGWAHSSPSLASRSIASTATRTGRSCTRTPPPNGRPLPSRSVRPAGGGYVAMSATAHAPPATTPPTEPRPR